LNISAWRMKGMSRLILKNSMCVKSVCNCQP
jgi:hypothetical protein